MDCCEYFAPGLEHSRSHAVLANQRHRTAVRYLLLSCFAVVILYPFVLMIFGSLKTETAFLANPVSPPTTLDLGNYQFAWNEAHIPKFALNSLIVAAGTVFLTLVTGSMAAFALEPDPLSRSHMDLSGICSAPNHSCSNLYYSSLCHYCPGSSFRFSSRSHPALYRRQFAAGYFPAQNLLRSVAVGADGRRASRRMQQPNDLAEGRFTAFPPGTFNRYHLHFCAIMERVLSGPGLHSQPGPANIAARSAGVFRQPI